MCPDLVPRPIKTRVQKLHFRSPRLVTIRQRNNRRPLDQVLLWGGHQVVSRKCLCSLFSLQTFQSESQRLLKCETQLRHVQLLLLDSEIESIPIRKSFVFESCTENCWIRINSSSKQRLLKYSTYSELQGTIYGDS